MDSIRLCGTEQVENAGYAMRQAAERMAQVPGNLDEVLSRHQRFLDDWLSRLEEVLTRVAT